MKTFAVCLCAVILFFGMAATGSATPIDFYYDPYEAQDESAPADFPAGPYYFYGFGDEAPGSGDFTDIDTGGYLTVSGGGVSDSWKDLFLTLSGNYYYDVSLGVKIISLSFLENASALGMSFVTDTLDIALNLYANEGDLSPVDSYALSSDSGFIGIVLPEDVVFTYATITTNTGAALYIDDIKYQIVPIPVSILLLGSGLIGLVGLKRKFKK